jgi:cation diffusion facilitator CzcD-associated flavoprotein CzcO
MNAENLIIGAGPSGLAMAARLKQAGLSYVILEQANKVGSKWHQHYDRLHLHTVKELSCLPYVDFPDHYPQYISKFQLIEYFNSYVEKFEIKPEFNSTVTSVKKLNSNWTVECSNGKIYTAKNVVVASGLNRVPSIPIWKGLELFKGEVMHASTYKNAQVFLGKKVLVVGMGNTGAELALDLAEQKIEVSLSVRGEITIVPRDFLGRSVQLTANKLNKLPYVIGDWIGSLSGKIAFGNLRKYGLPISNIPPAKMRRVFGKTPTIDIGTVAKIKSGEIKVRKGIAALTENGVVFTNGISEKYDVLLLATGYTASLKDFILAKDSLFIENGEPAKKLAHDEEEGLYFLGFEKYTYGGTLGTLKAESELILKNIIFNSR